MNKQIINNTRKIVGLVLLSMVLLSGYSAEAQTMPKPIQSKTTPQPIKVDPSVKAPAGIVNFKNMDSAEAGILAKILLDSTVSIGIFEAPGMRTLPRKLRNGLLPELENNYLEAVLGNALIKLNTVSVLRGNFDSMIYLQTPTLNSDGDEPMQFLPYPDTRWLLFLKSPYNVNGKPTEKWVSSLEKAKAQNYLNPNTVYEVADEFHNNLIIKWDNEYSTPYNAFMFSETAYQELKALVSQLNTFRQSNSAVPSSFKTQPWQDPIIKKVAANLDMIFAIKPAPVKKEEPYIEGQ